MHLERLHPRFLERLREYIDAVCEVLAPRQITQGGPIALLGVDNEILYPYTTPEAQYYVDGDINVPYDEEYNSGELRSWLRDRYDSLDSLNGALGTDFRSWDEIGTPRYREDPVGYCLETFQFINHRVLAFARTCKSMYQEAGMVVPTYTNQKQLLGYIDWVPVAQELDSVGINLHLPRDMPGDRALVANWWYRAAPRPVPLYVVGGVPVRMDRARRCLRVHQRGTLRVHADGRPGGGSAGPQLLHVRRA